MEFRKAIAKDVNQILQVITDAQVALKKDGVDQWQNNYPNREVILKDISDQNAYVLLEEDNIIATAAVSFDGESTYEKIYEGQWITDGLYAVVHRVAVEKNSKRSGIATKMFDAIEKLCLSKDIGSIRVDTHEDNKAMQSVLNKNNFKYCGVIYLSDGSKRLAFEKNCYNIENML